MYLLRLVRFPNLMVVALTQWLVYWHVINGAYRKVGLESIVPYQLAIYLILTTCLVTAAGYVINDLSDTSIDRVNRARRMVIGRIVGFGAANWLYFCLVLAGFIASLMIALELGESGWLWLYPLASGLLAMYSPSIKRKPLLGNLLVSVYCAGAAGLFWLAERRGLDLLELRAPELAMSTYHILLIFMLFAFLATWLRELIKDMEDYEGDALDGRETVPIKWGMAGAQRFALALGAILATALLWPPLANWPGFRDPPVLILIALLLLWLTRLLFQLWRATQTRQFHALSLQLKLYLLGGLLLLYLYQI